MLEVAEVLTLAIVMICGCVYLIVKAESD